MSNIEPLFDGGLIYTPTPNETAIEECKRTLEQIEAGEVVGFAITMLHHDGLTSYRLAGMVGGYGMIGALEVVKSDLLKLVQNE